MARRLRRRRLAVAEQTDARLLVNKNAFGKESARVERGKRSLCLFSIYYYSAVLFF